MRPSQFNVNCRAEHTRLCCLHDAPIVSPLEHLCLTFLFCFGLFFFVDLDSEAPAVKECVFGQ